VPLKIGQGATLGTRAEGCRRLQYTAAVAVVAAVEAAVVATLMVSIPLCVLIQLVRINTVQHNNKYSPAQQ
jgi:hypothetical protein